MNIDILGTEYTIRKQSKAENPFLNDCDGYCDKTSKKMEELLKNNIAVKEYVENKEG